ncbi:MAG TPA: M12 family metallo-peptidase, partial [Pirellulales bacterium]|nr:M12 family metallo-peptidase [Pirellulales bacterium]
MIGRRIVACAFILAIACGEVRQAAADVVVLANRAGDAVRYRIAPAETKSAADAKDAWAKVEPGDIATIPIAGQATLEFLAGKSAEQYDVEADRCYFFYEDKAGDLQLEAIGLAGEEADRPTGDAPAPQRVEKTQASVPLVIPVKLLVDDDERAARGRWEARLRARLETASALFERCCRVKFVASEVAAWDSDDATTDFEQSLAEFEREVEPQPQRLAIGFTSQYPLVAGRVHLGGTRGPLHSHILLREWSQQISESERLEVLVHELGHFLGAVHSPESISVMRPNLGDRKARLREFRIAFDPLNALAMCLVGEALQQR